MSCHVLSCKYSIGKMQTYFVVVRSVASSRAGTEHSATTNSGESPRNLIVGGEQSLLGDSSTVHSRESGVSISNSGESPRDFSANNDAPSPEYPNQDPWAGDEGEASFAAYE